MAEQEQPELSVDLLLDLNSVEAARWSSLEALWSLEKGGDLGTFSWVFDDF